MIFIMQQMIVKQVTNCQRREKTVGLEISVKEGLICAYWSKHLTAERKIAEKWENLMKATG